MEKAYSTAGLKDAFKAFRTTFLPIHRGLFPGFRLALIIIAVCSSLFQIYTAAFGTLEALKQRSLHLGFALVLGFLTVPLGGKKGKAYTLLDTVLAALSILVTFYLFWDYERIVARLPYAEPLTGLDKIFAIVAILLTLELTRRCVSPFLALITALFLVYALGGPYLPSFLATPKITLDLLLDHQYLNPEGLYGMTTGVSATFVAMFIILAAFLERSPASNSVLDLANVIFWRFKGGAGKAAVVASSLVGMITGSAVANTAAAGTFTIPMMKKTGFTPAFAGGIEAVSSIGSQLMPPVMGAAAFIMAEIIGISYWKVCKAAIIPAILYYLALFIAVHFYADRLGLKGLNREEVPRFFAVFKAGWSFFVPLVLIVGMLALDYTPNLAAFWAIVGFLFVGFLQTSTRIPLGSILAALEKGAWGLIQVALACAAAGIIVGVLSLTGLGLKLSTTLIDASGGNLYILLFFTMLASLLLGTGLPTVPTYILLAVLVAPAIAKFGVPVLAAHIFVFYFGALADLTPPTMICVYTAAGIAGASPGRTSVEALKLSLAGFILPYMFVKDAGFIMQGSTLQILESLVFGVIGVTALAVAVQGFLLEKMGMPRRLIMLAAACLLIYPGLVSSLVGSILFFLIFALQLRARKKQREVKMVGSAAP